MTSRRRAIGALWLAPAPGRLLVRGRRGPEPVRGPAVARLVRVRAHPFERTLTAAAKVKASEAYRVFAALDGQLLHLLPEGRRVKKGELVARLDVNDTVLALRSHKIDHEIARLEHAIKD